MVEWRPSKVIRFKFSAEKAKNAVMLMLESQGKHDIHAILKACYFADVVHLNDYCRPVFGANYRAMKFGPVPLEIYEMLKGDPIWLAELEIERFPWKLDGYQVVKSGNDGCDTNVFSKSDLRAINAGFKKSSMMSFDHRTAATHGKDWQSAQLGMMRYEDMIEDKPEKEEIVAYLREAAPSIRL